MINLKDAQTPSPEPAAAWQRLSDAERLGRVNQALRAAAPALRNAVAVVAARNDGQVIVTLTSALSAAERGTVLLNFEAFLTSKVDPSVSVWLEPMGDKNSLRKLRGIEVKP